MGVLDWIGMAFLAGASLGALIATPIAYDRGRERAARDAAIESKWTKMHFAKLKD